MAVANRPRNSDKAKQAILEAAIDELREKGGRTVTVEAIARRSDHAKGLVLYHFKSKKALLEAAGRTLAERRASHWTSAFSASTPTDIIDQTWRLLTEESTNGVALAWASLLSPNTHLPDRVVKELAAGFAELLGEAGSGLFEVLEATPRVDRAELGWLLAAVVTGVEAALLSGADPATVSGAYTAAWLGLLSLAS